MTRLKTKTFGGKIEKIAQRFPLQLSWEKI